MLMLKGNVQSVWAPWGIRTVAEMRKWSMEKHKPAIPSSIQYVRRGHKSCVPLYALSKTDSS